MDNFCVRSSSRQPTSRTVELETNFPSNRPRRITSFDEDNKLTRDHDLTLFNDSMFHCIDPSLRKEYESNMLSILAKMESDFCN